MTDLTFIVLSFKGRCYGNQFCDQINEIGLPHFHSAN